MPTIQLIVSTALGLIAKLAPLFNDAATIEQAVSLLQTYVPIVEQFASDLAAPFKAVIAALLSNGAVTPDQVTSLQALDAQADTAFDAALAAYNAANPGS